MTARTEARAVTRRGARRAASALALATVVTIGSVTSGVSLGRTGGLSATPAVADASVLPAPAIDHRSRSSVMAAYQSMLVPALAVPMSWSGSVVGCVAGAPSAAAQDATLQAVNYFRAMADLPAVAFDPALSAKAQDAALMMAAANRLSHEPDVTWPCYTAAGFDAASHGNLYLGRTGAAAIAGYMVDPGLGNEIAGHRRWILFPPQTLIGSGSTANSNALYVVGPGGARPPAPAWTPWPPAGFVPAPLEPEGRWSLSANDPAGVARTDFSAATVTVTSNGATIPVDVQKVAVNFGDNTLVWQFSPDYKPAQGDRTFHVVVAGIVRNGATVSHTYDVTLADPGGAATPPGAPPTNPAVPGGGSGGAPGTSAPSATIGALSPARLLDTRAAAPTVDGQATGTGPVGPGHTLTVPVAGRGGVPLGAAAVVVNLTATGATGATYLTVFPSGSLRPTASNVNVVPGQTVANLVTVPVGPDGSISIYNNNGSVEVMIDVQAWYPAGAVGAVSPARLLDSRPGQPTVDGQASGTGTVRQGQTITVAVAGRGGVPAGAGAVVLNLTATGATADTYLTVFPTGSGRPTASNVNLGRGQTVANLVTATVGTDGTVSIFNNNGTVDVVVDVEAWYPSTAIGALSPARLLDTRPGAPTVDGQGAGAGTLAGGRAITVAVTGRAGVPSGAKAVVLNLTATGGDADAYLTVFPTGTARPTASNLNIAPGQTVANLVTATIGTDGTVSIFLSAGRTHVVVDVQAWFA